MYKNNNKFLNKNISKKVLSGFSLVEIIVSLALFSFIMTIIITVSLSLARAQQRVQAEVFLTQTAQTTLENISRNLRYSISYSGSTFEEYEANQNNIYIKFTPTRQDLNCVILVNGTRKCDVSLGETSQLLNNAGRSPFIVFESDGSGEAMLAGRNAYCFDGDRLYKVRKFEVSSTGTHFKKCKEGEEMLPEQVKLDYIYFDVYGQNSENPTNPMVRVRLKLSNRDPDLPGSIELQTTVTQRVIQYI